MQELFLRILKMSITASWVILFVLIARLLLKKAPKVYSYALWSVVLFRLICPFSMESALSLLPTKSTPIVGGIAAALPIAGQTAGGIMGYVSPTILQQTPRVDGILLGGIIWLIGIGVMLSVNAYSIWSLRKKLKIAVPERDNVFVDARISTPFVMGVISPKIYMPMGLGESEREYILLHERVHIRRKDHIIKIISFTVLSIHWFNPFVWISFFLSEKDMEMACDEAVMAKLGYAAKKEYSASLLSLSTGKPLIRATPLAFGEGSTKGRIKNILALKKPGFWVVLVPLILCICLGIGLIFNPVGSKEKQTEEFYAQTYVDDRVMEFENYAAQGFHIVEQKITKFSPIVAFDALMDYPIQLWQLEYRLRPEKPDEVVYAGGINMVDGWLTEESSMGSPILVFSYEEKEPQYLGILWSGRINEFESSKEIALRQLLEEERLLPKGFFQGNHAMAQFKMSTGETGKILLSQPSIQGKSGIWCVERWMDGNGNVYYHDPQVNTTLQAYYDGLQEEYQQGQNLWMAKESAVAWWFIEAQLGQQPERTGGMVVSENISVDDFMETPISTYVGYISSFGENYPDLFHFDPVEWITPDNASRIDELQLTDLDMPNGFYVYNPREDNLAMEVSEGTEYRFIDWNRQFKPLGEDRNYTTKDKEEFHEYLKSYPDLAANIPFWIETKDGYVISITEQYIP